MTKVYVSSVLPVTVEKAWAKIRDYNGLPAWHPMVAASRIEGGRSGGEVGVVRNFTLKGDGAVVREQLLALSDAEFAVTYNILEAPMPIRNYVSTLRLRRITDGGATFAEWSSEFDVASGPESDMVTLVTEVYQSGFDSLKKLLR